MASDAFRLEGSRRIKLLLIGTGCRRNQCQPSYKHCHHCGQRHHFEYFHVSQPLLISTAQNRCRVAKIRQCPCRANLLSNSAGKSPDLRTFAQLAGKVPHSLLLALSESQATSSSVRSLCSLCLCGSLFLRKNNHRDTENTKVAQRKHHQAA